MALMRIPLSALPLLFALVFLPGCIAFYGHRQVEVTAIDAETREAIPNAKVDVYYLYMLVLNAPKPTSVRTNADGMASIRAANFALESWTAASPSFLQAKQMIGSKPRPKTILFELYRDPPPSMTIVLPRNYHGPLLIDRVAVPAQVDKAPGQRQFVFRAASNGYVRINATPLLMRHLNEHVHIDIFDEDAHAIRQADYRVGKSETALRWVTLREFHDGQSVVQRRDLYVVGDDNDREKYEDMVHDVKRDDRGGKSMTLNDAAFNRLFDEARDEASAHPAP